MLLLLPLLVLVILIEALLDIVQKVDSMMFLQLVKIEVYVAILTFNPRNLAQELTQHKHLLSSKLAYILLDKVLLLHISIADNFDKSSFLQESPGTFLLFLHVHIDVLGFRSRSWLWLPPGFCRF